jgi:hypothetical protein
VVGDVAVVFGVVVGVVVLGVADAADVADEVPVDDWPDTVVAVVEAVDGEVTVDPDVDVPVVAVVTVDEWAVVPEATIRPRATAAAEAATPMATVARRTRATARSRECAAEERSVWLFLCRGAMADLSL